MFVARVVPDAAGGSESELEAEIAALLGNSELTGNPLVLVGSSPARALQELVEADRDFGLIVLGSTHRAGLGRVLPGSVAERLLNGAPCCVAVAPRGFADGVEREESAAGTTGADTPPTKPLKLADDLRVIAVGFDASSEAGAALSVAVGLARPVEAALRVIAVGRRLPAPGALRPDPPATAAPASEDLESLLLSEVAELPAELRALPVFERGDPAGLLLAKAQERVDLLAVGSRGYGPARSVLIGGVSAHVLREAPCPVLVTPRAAVASS